jgi:Protein of unknown function (DUF3616)
MTMYKAVAGSGVALAYAAFGLMTATAAEPVMLIQGAAVPVLGDDFRDDDGKTSVNMSGIACTPPGPPKRLCVAIDDEGREAQIATLTNAGLTPGGRVRLIGEEAATGIVGAPPTEEHCGKKDDFKDLDGEAVAYAEPFFYVIGSHGCSRSKNKFRVSSFITARFRLDASGSLVKPDGTPLPTGADPGEGVETTYRVSDALTADADIHPWFAMPLEGDNREGMNIEGLAVIEDTLYAGLRAPWLDKSAFVVPVSVKALFAPGPMALSTFAIIIKLPLDRKAGIRDLSPLPDGRVIVLTGPTLENPDEPFEVWTARLDTRTMTPLGKLEDRFFTENGKRKRAKAEGILPLAVDGDALSVLVLFDGLPNGGPVEYHKAPPK